MSVKYRHIYDLGVQTGLRIGDILRITPDNVKGDTLHLTEQKTNKTRDFAISHYQANWIRKHEKNKPVFNVSRQACWKYFKRHAERYSDKNVGTHSMRKKFALNKLTECGNVFEVQRAMGHDNINVTLMYLFGECLQSKNC